MLNPEQTAKAFDMLFEAMDARRVDKEVEIEIVESEVNCG